MTTIVEAVSRALVSGTVAGLTTSAAAALAGKREAGSYVAPVNATSHILWGEKAGRKAAPSLKYTASGFLLNHLSGIFWATFYEKWFSRRGEPGPAKTMMKPVLGAVVVTAGAYLTDYYLVPKRFTPGWEKRLSGKSLAAIYGMLALGLIASDLLDATRKS
jgi:hypothetical protein